MDRHKYYEKLKELAREKRNYYKVDTAAFGLREVRKIYKAEGIKIDYWVLPPKIKALYMCADNDFSVAVKKNLPDEPKLFALIHELKHHYTDQELIKDGVVHCGEYNRNEKIEIGAEVFAAEFIYPEAEFASDINQNSVSDWQPENLVEFKRDCKAKISYQFLQKRLIHLGIIEQEQFKGVKFKNLEEKIYGVPYHRKNMRFWK